VGRELRIQARGGAAASHALNQALESCAAGNNFFREMRVGELLVAKCSFSAL
jgi:hypothetical protein